MNDLIKEIEQLKERFNSYTNYTDGYFDCVDEVLTILDQCNIIIAPKFIKTSEIVSKLKDEQSPFSRREIRVSKENNEILIREYYEIEIDGDILPQSYLLVVIKDNKIDEINIESELVKWLYSLWIAGTIIIDDLK